MVNKNNSLPAKVDATRCVEDLIRKFVPLEEFGSIRAVDPTLVAEPFQSCQVSLRSQRLGLDLRN